MGGRAINTLTKPCENYSVRIAAFQISSIVNPMFFQPLSTSVTKRALYVVPGYAVSGDMIDPPSDLQLNETLVICFYL